MRPSRRPRLGQNFLSSPRTAERIVNALATDPGSWVLEVGPGRGALTRPLLARGTRVLAVEVDGRLVARLTEELGCDLLRLIEADALRFDPAAALAEAGAAPPVPLVANLPYESATPMVRAFARRRDLFSRLVVMVQREVAERICSRPGEDGYGFLSVDVAFHAKARRLFDVPPGDYQATLYCYASAPNGRLCLEAAGSDERLGAWFRRTRAGQEMPGWLHNRCVDDPDEDPGHKPEWKKAPRRPGSRVIDFLLHLEPAAEVTAGIKVAKVYVLGEDTQAAAEMFLADPHDLGQVFSRALRALQGAVRRFSDLMQDRPRLRLVHSQR